MTNEQQQVRDWMKAYGQEAPEKPIIPSLEVRKLRAKLILEEALETISALGLSVYATDSVAPVCVDLLEASFVYDECQHTLNLIGILDGCEDLKVVTEGTLVACGLLDLETNSEQDVINGSDYYANGDPHFDEVMRSNWTKLWTDKEVAEYENNPDNPRLTIRATKHNGRWLVKDKDGKVIKSPSFSPPKFEI